MTQHEDGQLPAHQTVAAEVRAELARQRISGRQAARRLGWTQQSLSRRLTGDIPFDVAELAELAALLGVPVTAFFPQDSPKVLVSGGLRRAPISAPVKGSSRFAPRFEGLSADQLELAA